MITLLDEGLSLQPLNTSIDELTAAIREVLEEGQVRLQSYQKKLLLLFFIIVINFLGSKGYLYNLCTFIATVI